MSDSYLRRARTGDSAGDGIIVDISPASAGWSYSSLRVMTLPQGGAVRVMGSDNEWIVLPLAGSFEVTCEADHFDLRGRRSVFSRVSDFAYVGRDAPFTVSSTGGGRVALCGAVARRPLPSRYGAAEDVPVEVRGGGMASRQVNNFAAPDAFEADRLIAVEVLTPGGNWSSYPPHKHDELREGEAILEEIYYFEVDRDADATALGPGGYQRVYTSGPDRRIDVLAEVRTGDAITIPFGYHGPTMAAPGYDLYFLNVLAGPGDVRTMAFRDDPAHGWIRRAWADWPIDSRVPMTSAEETR